MEWIEKALITRLKESYLQSKAIRTGISSIVPQALLNLATYQELNIWICGKTEVDLELLQQNTKYAEPPAGKEWNEKTAVI